LTNLDSTGIADAHAHLWGPSKLRHPGLDGVPIDQPHPLREASVPSIAPRRPRLSSFTPSASENRAEQRRTGSLQQNTVESSRPTPPTSNDDDL
jgi:hypothetical protein